MAKTEQGRHAETVVVHGEDVRVDRMTSEVPLAEVRSRFGGVDGWALVAGLTAALGALVVLSTLLAAAGVAGGGQVDRETLSIAGLIAGVVALGLALLLGGYIAGRVARYSGVRNGLLVGVLFVLVTAALSALAARAGAEADLSLPQWLDRDTATTAALVTGATALVVALAASTLGGLLGGRWHRKVDSALLNTRPSGLTSPYPGDGSEAVRQ